MSKQLKVWLERVNAPTISHHQVIQLARCVYPMSRGARAGGKASNLEPDEAREIIQAIFHRARLGTGVRATPDNEQRGRDWLNENRRKLELPDVDYLSIVDFRLVGFHIYGEDRWGMNCAPIWRCSFPDGSQLDYAPTAWQASMMKEKRQFWWRWEAKPR